MIPEQRREISATRAWLKLLELVLHDGRMVSPRSRSTREVPAVTVGIDMRYPVVTVPARGLSYSFMAAEALWILDGDDRVETIAPWNKRIVEFSDDGRTYFGAYGPRFVEQLPYVADRLSRDQSSRQAVVDLWRQRVVGHETKDVPCTLNLTWHLRRRPEVLSYPITPPWVLDCHVYMRSSDLWLGSPYDWFNEVMMTVRVAHELEGLIDDPIVPGTLWWTTASAHLYDDSLAGARTIIDATTIDDGAELPAWAFSPGGYERIYTSLLACRDRTTDQDDSLLWRIRPRKEKP